MRWRSDALEGEAAMRPEVTICKDGDRLAVRSMPTSGPPAGLLSAAGIDAQHIAEAVRECMHEAPHHAPKKGRT
jgi:transketolase